MKRAAGNIFAALAMLLLGAASAGHASASDALPVKPARIVSINLCADQMLLELVPRERIAAVSHLAADPTISAVAHLAAGLPSTRGEGEHVLNLRPDLVLASAYTPAATLDMLRRLGLRITVVPAATNIAGIGHAVEVVAAAVGEQDKGRALVAAFERRIAAIASDNVNRPGAREWPTALVYRVSSLADGSAGLADDALRAAGFRNMAADMKLGPGGRLPLERLVATPPDAIVLGHRIGEYARTAAAENLRHPAFAWLLSHRAVGVLPQPVTLCATTRLADAIEGLARLRAGIVRGRSQ